MEIKDPLPERIGLVSDSHSELNALETAIHKLQKRGADTLVHLGDVCDSMRLDLLEDSIGLLRKHRVTAVKGNNDFVLEKLLQGKPPEQKVGTGPLVDFLCELPIVIVWDCICFAHSLPFDFLRAIYDPIDDGSTNKAEEVFCMTSYRITFCGHSHRPVLFRYSQDRVYRELIPENRPIVLDPEDRHILVTGAVTEGECTLFDVKQWSLERIRI